MAVKLYEKDPSKLTTLEDRIPISTGSDISDEDDSNHGISDTKTDTKNEAATTQAPAAPNVQALSSLIFS